MIVFIDNEHERAYETEWGERLLAARTRIKYRLEDICGDQCLIIRYTHVNPVVLRDLNARAIFVSGNGTDYEFYTEADQAGLRAVFREEEWPTFGFCGGFQVMAETYGVSLEKIGPLAEGETDPFPQWGPGQKKEFGYFPVQLTAKHPLLEGLDDKPVVRHAHMWEIKQAPSEFDVIAKTEMSTVQMIVHKNRPIIGTQFHPEYYTDEHLAGRIIIENFCRWAGLI